MAGKNIGFNSELHDLFMKEVDGAEDALKIVMKSFNGLYPHHDRGPEARVARNMSSVLRSIEGVRIAMKEIREAEGER